MTCKECIHYNACKFTYIEAFGSFNEEQFGQTGCAEFQDKSRFAEVDKVAEMLRQMFADDCACNYNGNDEWLPFMCKYAETDCPMPKDRLGCWKELVKHYIAKMNGERKGE
ncbi:MAG: hypothetical protein J6Q10_03015 [Clostridia bacterium]|nr:hypothetical protein [Clostridia bacterium]